MSTGVYFLHIGKIAGTTFRWLLEGQYPAHTCAYIYADLGQEELRIADAFPPIDPALAAHIQCFSSNAPLGTYSMLEQSLRIVTMLREPIDRMVSLYYYRKRQTHTQNEIIQRLSMPDYIEWMASRHQDNGQVRLISGLGYQGAVTDNVLEQAKHNLREKIAAFGLKERFSESMVLFRRILGWQKPITITQNIGKNRQPLDRALHERIAAHNQYDTQLYDYAYTLFQQRLSQAPISVQEREAIQEARGLDRMIGYQQRVIRKLFRIQIPHNPTTIAYQPSQEEQLYA